MKWTAKTTETKRLKSISMTNPKLLSLAALLCAVQSFSQVTISGRVKNTTDSVIVFKKNLPHPILREVDSKPYRAKIEANGIFHIQLPEENISEWVAEFGNNQWQLFDLAKGQTLKIEADFSGPFPLKAIGKFADDFNYSSYWWDKMLRKYYHDSGYSQNLRNLSVDSILKLKVAEYKYAGQLLEEYRKSHILSDKYYQWLITKYRYIPYRLVSLDNAAKGDKEIFYNHLSRVRFDDDYAALNSYCYAAAVDVYLHYKFNGGVYPMGVKDYLDFVSACTGISSLTRQTVLARELCQLTKSGKWDTLYKKYVSFVSDGTLLGYITQERSNYLTSLAAIRITEEINPNLSISEIFSKYKGKVLYIDLWASWCAPCRSEMPEAKELKEKLAGKDVVFIYLGYEDKLENWLIARKDLEIEGEHYLLDSIQLREANELFEVNGIPHYVIVDKEGRIVNKNAERPGEVYETLLKLL